MGKRQFILGIFLASILGGAIAIGGYKMVGEDPQPQYENFEESQNVAFSSFLEEETVSPKAIVPEGLNFIEAAKVATPGVVHIKSIFGENNYDSNPSIYDFFGFGNPESRRSRATGSGVIISRDGYIVTNNHVVENAEKIEVTLNSNERFSADVIGTDPTTDLALLKIEGESLDYLKFGNSDDLQIGEWVLAVGNPFDLTSTVTAGIISAKGRNINILRDPNGRQIESFIQTDAVVNPGNSGGALVNLNGELVGINTAIASPTGSYTGYSFAVPVTLVKKVMNDLKNYGEVQRAVLGVSIADLDDPSLIDKVDVYKGVYISRVSPGSAAEDAGIEEGDIIIKINGRNVDNMAELQETVAQNPPGTTIDVTFLRDGRERKVAATLKNLNNNYEIVRRSAPMTLEGARFEDLTGSESARLEIRGGVKVTSLGEGKWQEAGIERGFIITHIDRERVLNVEELKSVLSERQGNLTVLGVYPNGSKDYYSLDW